MRREPLLLYVPGLKAKPPPATHRHELFRVLVEGVRRIDPETAADLHEYEPSFDVVGWTYDFYGEHRDIALDHPSIERLLKQEGPTEKDMRRARSHRRRLVQWLYRAADRLPFLIPQIADEDVQLHLRDLRRYVDNDYEIAEATRRLVKLPLRAAWKSRRPILLIGHSMGSVIAYDTLWQMSHLSRDDVEVDLFLSLGSPLGMRYIQRRLLGAQAVEQAARYPHNIRRWVNIAAIGELTAIDMRLQNDFSRMLELGLVREIEDHAVYNYYHADGELNVHSEYGYLINETTARLLRDWWRQARG